MVDSYCFQVNVKFRQHKEENALLRNFKFWYHLSEILTHLFKGQIPRCEQFWEQISYIKFLLIYSYLLVIF